MILNLATVVSALAWSHPLLAAWNARPTRTKTFLATKPAPTVPPFPRRHQAVITRPTAFVLVATKKWTIKAVTWNVPRALKPVPTNCTVTDARRTTTKTLPATMPALSAPPIPTTTYAIKPALTLAFVSGGI